MSLVQESLQVPNPRKATVILQWCIILSKQWCIILNKCKLHTLIPIIFFTVLLLITKLDMLKVPLIVNTVDCIHFNGISRDPQ